MRALPTSVSWYETDTGGPGSTARTMRPAAWSSVRRSARTESLMPATLRRSSAKPDTPLLNVPRMTPFHRLPKKVNAWARDPSQDFEDSSSTARCECRDEGGTVTSLVNSAGMFYSLQVTLLSGVASFLEVTIRLGA